MKILIAPDSFKGSLKSPDVARAMAAGARAATPQSELRLLPAGDGGEGTLEALVAATGGRYETHRVADALGRDISARLGLLGDGETVFVEMAEASGLSRLSPSERDPLRTTTFGTGQLLRAALATGRKRLLVGIGGSATNDGGAGMLQALGIRLLDASGRELPPGGAALRQLADLDLSHFHALDLLPDVPGALEIVVACDVTNPLTGPQGASAIYGPQKGAAAADIRLLDDALSHFADIAAAKLGIDHRNTPGAGAAGGLGFALLAFLQARLERGVQLVLDTVRFEEQLQGADLVITGEGQIDRQTTAFGKTLTGIGERAARAGVPVLALAGSLAPDLDGESYRRVGIRGVSSVIPRPMSLEQAMQDAEILIQDATRRMLEIFLASR